MPEPVKADKNEVIASWIARDYLSPEDFIYDLPEPDPITIEPPPSFRLVSIPEPDAAFLACLESMASWGPTWETFTQAAEEAAPDHVVEEKP